MYLYGSPISYNTCNPCCQFNRIGTSVSRWCSDGRSDGQPCDSWCDPCSCIMPRYAYLTQIDAIIIGEGQPIPFSGASALGEGFTLMPDGRLEIEEPGVYRLDYRVNIPSNATVDTAFVVQLDGVDVAGTRQSVQHFAGSAATSVMGHAIIEVMQPASLALITTAALNMAPDMLGDTLATLTVTSL